MWTKKLSSTQLPCFLSRAIASSDSCFSIGISRCFDSSLFNFHSLCSSQFYSDSPFLGGKPVPSARVLFSPNQSSTLSRESPNLFLKNYNFFCSEPDAAEKFHCWKCGAAAESETPFLFCQECHSVQPLNEAIDYFQIFGLERKYEIEHEELEKKYKDWQKKLHPDLVHSKSQRERDYAAEQSARVIDAYSTLTDPLSRAIYALKMEGMLVDEEERITDPELLAEVMELREAVEEAKDDQTLNKIQVQLQGTLQNWSKLFSAAYTSKNYEECLAAIRRMTYYKRANEEVVKKL